MLLRTYLLTYSLGSSEAGEFAANLYLSTAPGQGSLSIYPVQPNDPNPRPNPNLNPNPNPTPIPNLNPNPNPNPNLTLTLSP